MTQSPVTVTYSLEKILGDLNQKLDNLQKDVTDIKTGQIKLEAELKGEIKALEGKLTGNIQTLEGKLTGDIQTLEGKLTGNIQTLDTKVDGLGKRLENQEFISRGVLVALIIAILGGFAKLFGFVGNP